MALGSKVNDAINPLVVHQLVECLEVADIHLHKLVVGLMLDVLEVTEVASIGQLVEVDDAVVGVLVHEEAHNMRADKSRTTGDNYSFHLTFR